VKPNFYSIKKKSSKEGNENHEFNELIVTHFLGYSENHEFNELIKQSLLFTNVKNTA
jgi:hypothetical protein